MCWTMIKISVTIHEPVSSLISFPFVNSFYINLFFVERNWNFVSLIESVSRCSVDNGR